MQFATAHVLARSETKSNETVMTQGGEWSRRGRCVTIVSELQPVGARSFSVCMATFAKRGSVVRLAVSHSTVVCHVKHGVAVGTHTEHIMHAHRQQEKRQKGPATPPTLCG